MIQAEPAKQKPDRQGGLDRSSIREIRALADARASAWSTAGFTDWIFILPSDPTDESVGYDRGPHAGIPRWGG